MSVREECSQMYNKIVSLNKTYPRTQEEALDYKSSLWGNKVENKVKEELKLQEGFTWGTFDLNNEEHLSKISVFLTKYYVDDTQVDNTQQNQVTQETTQEIKTIKQSFNKQYTPQLLKYLLHDNILSLGIVYKSHLIAFVTSSSLNLQLNNKNISNMSNINFLCVRPKLRSNRISVVLIKELHRRLGLLNSNIYIFNSYNKYFYEPLATLKIYNRPLNIEHLLDTQFTQLVETFTRDDLIKQYRLPKKPANSNFIKLDILNVEHVKQALVVLTTYLNKYNVYTKFTEESFKRRFLNNDNITTSYVLINENNQVTDFISYYVILNLNQENKIKIAYLDYYASMTETAYRLVSDMLIVARNDQVDLFIAKDNFENSNILVELNFNEGKTINNNYVYIYDRENKEENTNINIKFKLNSSNLAVSLVL